MKKYITFPQEEFESKIVNIHSILDNLFDYPLPLLLKKFQEIEDKGDREDMLYKLDEILKPMVKISEILNEIHIPYTTQLRRFGGRYYEKELQEKLNKIIEDRKDLSY